MTDRDDRRRRDVNKTFWDSSMQMLKSPSACVHAAALGPTATSAERWAVSANGGGAAANGSQFRWWTQTGRASRMRRGLKLTLAVL